jgi:hypothetical protein
MAGIGFNTEDAEDTEGAEESEYRIKESRTDSRLPSSVPSVSSVLKRGLRA